MHLVGFIEKRFYYVNIIVLVCIILIKDETLALIIFALIIYLYILYHIYE